MIKVNYNTETTLVQGYYPDSVKYNSIPEPFIEIEDEQQILDKTMCVIDGVYQEYIPSKEEILSKAKQEKLAELDKYYQSNECWTYQIVNGKNSLTKTADWFSSMIPPCLGKKIFLESDSGLIEYALPRDVGENLLYQIKIISSLEIKKLYNELKVKIQEAKNKEELEKLNIKSFLGKTPRVMKI